jgi:hypothetical protein
MSRRLTVDNCVLTSAMSKQALSEPDTAECRKFLDHLKSAVGVKLFQPAGFLLEMFVRVPRKVASKGLDLPYLKTSFPFQFDSGGLELEFVDVTWRDILEFYPARSPEEQEGLSRVTPAYDIEYVIAAYKSKSVLVTVDQKLLAANGSVPILRPSQIRL